MPGSHDSFVIMEGDANKGATGEEMRRRKNNGRRKVPSSVLFYKGIDSARFGPADMTSYNRRYFLSFCLTLSPSMSTGDQSFSTHNLGGHKHLV